MNARDFLDLKGREAAEQVAVKAGTTYAYFYQIARGNRRPSVKLAEKLVKASNQELDFVALLRSARS